MGLQYRCSRKECRKRKALKKKIDQYVRRPMCPECGHDSLKPVYEYEYQRAVKRGCFCQGSHWPHNKGRIQDPDHICIHADYDLAEAYLESWELGSTLTVMKPEDDCPF